MTDRITIEPIPDGRACYGGDHGCYRHSTYPAHSVLAGQTQRAFLGGGSREELITQFPNAEVLEHTTLPFSEADFCDEQRSDSLADYSGLPSTPPSWFDPADAGERWDSDY